MRQGCMRVTACTCSDTQLCFTTRPGCWQCTRLVACLSFSHMRLGCCCGQLFIHLRSPRSASTATAICAAALWVGWSAFVSHLRTSLSRLALRRRNQITQTIRLFASCERLMPQPIGSPGRVLSTGSLCNRGSVHPQWPWANVRAYHIANCNLWQQILIAVSDSVTLLKWQW